MIHHHMSPHPRKSVSGESVQWKEVGVRRNIGRASVSKLPAITKESRYKTAIVNELLDPRVQ